MKTKNKYILPFNGYWYIEFGGPNKKTSHSWDLISQRYAYDFEIRKDDLPYHTDPVKCENYYSYLEDVIAPQDGYVVDIVNEYENTRITKDRVTRNDIKDPRGNYIVIKHKYGEHSVICHIEKDTFKVNIGDIIKKGQVIAKVGNSGNTNGPHIHYQVQKGYDFGNSKGLIIRFENAYINNKKKKIIKCKNYVNTKKD